MESKFRHICTARELSCEDGVTSQDFYEMVLSEFVVIFGASGFSELADFLHFGILICF